MKKLTDDQVMEICDRYKKGESSPILGTKFNVSSTTIFNKLKDNNIKRKKSNFYTCKRKYFLNEKYFDQIDTPEKAYWLGFIAGDGYLGKNYLCINLMEKDKTHLCSFSNALDSNIPVKRYRAYIRNGKDYYCARISVNSKHLHTALKKYFKPNKTFTLKFPKLGSDFDRHYIRGVFDADGCSSWSRFSIASANELFLIDIQKILMKELGFKKTKFSFSKRSKTIELAYSGGKQLRKIYDYLYKDAIIYLDRKKEKLEEEGWKTA